MTYISRTDIWNYFDKNIKEKKAVCKECKKVIGSERIYNLRKHLKKVHHSNSEAWNYFENVSREGVAMCKICKRRIRNNRNYNLKLHLMNLHNIVVDGDDTAKKDETVKKRTTKRRMVRKDSFTSKLANRCLNIEMEEKTLIRSVLGLMLNDGVVPKMFSSTNMQALLKPLCESLYRKENKSLKIDETEAERVLCSLAAHISNKFANDLNWRLLSLKIDTDSSTSVNMFCLQALFIKNGEVHTHTLGLINHQNKNGLTEESIKEVLHKWNIDSNQIVSAFWDDTKLHCFKKVENSDYLSEIEKFESVNDIPLGDGKVERYVSSTAQLCILDLFKQTTLFEPFLQCRNLVKFINDESNNTFKDFVDKSLKIPQLDSPWKYGSTYTMMKHLDEARNVLKDIKYEYEHCSEDYFKVDDKLWTFVDAYCKTVSRMQKSLIMYNSENMHFGDFYAQWLKCQLAVEKILQDNKHHNNYSKQIATALLDSIKIRSNNFLNREQYVACLYLDPRFQQTLDIQHKSQAQNYLKKLWAMSKIYNTDIANSNELLKEESLDEDDEDLNSYLSQNIQNLDKRTSNVYFKIETLKLTFQPSNTNVLQFWKTYAAIEPEIYALSEICFAIPATQIYEDAPYAQLYQTKDMEDLPTCTKENLIQIRLNAHLIENEIDEIELFREPDQKSSDNEEFILDD